MRVTSSLISETDNEGKATGGYPAKEKKLKHQYNTRRFRTISWELLEVFPFYKLLPKPKRESLMLHHYFDHKSFANADWVWGAFMLFPKNIIQQLPKKKLSDDFFMYCEDVLWCWDFKQLGYQIHFLPQATDQNVDAAFEWSGGAPSC